MSTNYTAVIQRDGKLWVGWLEEIPGVNGLGGTKKACIDSLRSALKEALEFNRAEALSSATQPYEEVSIQV